MKRKNAFSSLIAWLIGLSVFCLFADSSALASQSVKFKQIKHFVIVPVTVNGTGPFDFIFDTGASSTVIDHELAKQLKLSPVETTSVSTVAGLEVVSRYRLNSLAVGPRSVENLMVLSTEMREICSINSKIRGILGQNFLSGSNYILNYRDRRIEFEEDNEFERRITGTRLMVERDRGRMLVEAKPSSSSKESARLVMDSGASSVVVFWLPRGCGFDIQMDVNGAINASTITGRQMLMVGRVRKLQIGEEKFDNLPVRLAQNRMAIEGRPENGLLPTSLFRAIYFNSRESFVILNPGFAE